MAILSSNIARKTQNFISCVFTQMIRPDKSLRSAKHNFCSKAFFPNRNNFFLIRKFSTSSFSKKEQKHEDQTLEGRYATALYRVAIEKRDLDRVYSDLDSLRALMKENKDFNLFVEIPGVSTENKTHIVKYIGEKYDLSSITINFLFLLLDNKRFSVLPKVVEAFEAFYREAKGEIKCYVTSAKDLTSSQKSRLTTVLQEESGPNAKLIIDYIVQPTIASGVIIRMGEQVYEFSLASRLERLQSQLLAPIQNDA